ncbi:MarR family winged helix-turn-helix transcriptional regulator [Serratia microhaemolytica]|uniref:MarR family winged helix-turn-helix transcriptional regulator n=1 Tax=Serratia microhaemolytica TaxID=2675110 RepID=UPI000FDDA114|nr:MarR family transcriptional regulator [Serratia microhaemolytica]
MQTKYDALMGQAIRYQGIAPERLQLIVSLASAVGRVTRQCATTLADFQLPEGQFIALLLLRHYGSLKPSDIAEKAGLTRSGITSVLDSLEARDLIQRHHQRDDRRSWLIDITETGSLLLDELLPHHLTGLLQLTAKFDDEDVQSLQRLLSKLLSD